MFHIDRASLWLENLCVIFQGVLEIYKGFIWRALSEKGPPYSWLGTKPINCLWRELQSRTSSHMASHAHSTHVSIPRPSALSAWKLWLGLSLRPCLDFLCEDLLIRVVERTWKTPSVLWLSTQYSSSHQVPSILLQTQRLKLLEPFCRLLGNEATPYIG